jgi:hypothetical protein
MSVVWTPSRVNSNGKAPQTSAKPPVLQKGTASLLARTTCIETPDEIRSRELPSVAT